MWLFNATPIQDEIDEDEREEFKIKSFVTMVEGLQNIGFPCWTSSGIGRSKHTVREFSLTAIEKWPIVQSYALEGVGKWVETIEYVRPYSHVLYISI